MTRTLARAAISSILFGAVLVSWISGPRASDSRVELDLMRPRSQRRDWESSRGAVERGLRSLRAAQQSSGAIGSRFPVAVTSLAGLAALGAGCQPGAGAYGDMLLGCLNYLEASANPLTGFITEAGDGESRMHGHAYALLFLAEIFGSLPPEREDSIRQLIKGGLRVMQLAQSVDGGWYYGPEPSPREDEASITVCALQALRAARDVGFVVDANRVDRAIRYVKACQQPSGMFSYSLRMSSRTSYALTAAAMSTLNAAGVYRSPELARGFDYLRRALASASSPWDAAEEEYDFYANMYVAQALWQDGGDLWDRWYTAVRDRLLSTEKSGGSWECRFGGEYATAVAILILEVPLGYLPTFQR